jgi:hypothetical protein
MLLTKKYFKNYQMLAVGGCVVIAILVGSVQTGLIVKNIKKHSR